MVGYRRAQLETRKLRFLGIKQYDIVNRMLITRTVDPRDLDIITEWWYQEWKDTYKLHGIDTLQKARLDVMVRVQNGSMDVFIVREGSSIVAVAALVSQQDPAIPYARMWLSNVYTRPENRYEGYGTELIRAVIRHTTGVIGEDTLYVTTTPDLLHWYKGFGFVTKGCDADGNLIMCLETGSVSPTLFT